MRKLSAFLGLILMGLTALPAQAQLSQKMSHPLSDNIITTRGDDPIFGMSIIPGTQPPSDAVCQNATNNQNQNQKQMQKTVCIKIPDDPAQRIWWRDQYLDQLESLGWNTTDAGMTEWPFLAMATGVRQSGCTASLLVLMVYDGDGREAQNKTGTPLEALNATYLVFLENTTHCQF